MLGSAAVTSDPLVQVLAPGTSEPRDWPERLRRLRAWLGRQPRAVVAYSGGVDSSLLLRVAVETLGDRALGVVGRSDSYSARELELALAQAARFGARVEVVATGELSDPNFRENPVNRCYYCKRELYRRLEEVARREGGAVIVDGTIADDLTDHRPGRMAAAEQGVRSPLAELGFTKLDVRAAAASLGLDSAEKPASPCLASRIPYGTTITPEMLDQVERAEEVLRGFGLSQFRVRHHGEVARIEVPTEELPLLISSPLREALIGSFKSLGFRFIALDLEGFRSGSLNPLWPGKTAPGMGELLSKDAGGGVSKKAEPPPLPSG